MSDFVSMAERMGGNLGDCTYGLLLVSRLLLIPCSRLASVVLGVRVHSRVLLIVGLPGLPLCQVLGLCLGAHVGECGLGQIGRLELGGRILSCRWWREGLEGIVRSRRRRRGRRGRRRRRRRQRSAYIGRRIPRHRTVNARTHTIKDIRFTSGPFTAGPTPISSTLHIPHRATHSRASVLTTMTGRRQKKQSIVYKDDPEAKAKELESFLFGAGRQAPESLFEQAADDEDDTITEMLRKVRRRGSLRKTPLSMLLWPDGPSSPSQCPDPAGFSAFSLQGAQDGTMFMEDKRPMRMEKDGGDDDGDEEEGGAASGGEEGADEEELSARRSAGKTGALAPLFSAARQMRILYKPFPTLDAPQAPRPAAAAPPGVTHQPLPRPQAPSPHLMPPQVPRPAAADPPGVTQRTLPRPQAPSPHLTPPLPGSKASGRRPAWNDPADAKLKINVAGQARLRKLRQTEGQTVVNGKHPPGATVEPDSRQW